MIYQKYNDGKQIKQYTLWCDMRKRCKPDYHRPEYHGCSVSDEFQNYPFFYDWCLKQSGFGESGFQLDKDILVKGNRVYSPDTCVFVPQRINQIFTMRKNHRGDYPIGVSCRSGRFYSRYFENGRQVQKSFANMGDAFQFYKENKERVIRELASEYRHMLDIRVYEALIKYTVEIDD